MRVAVIGDIHGNAPALYSVLIAAKLREVECLLINGDLIGYYFEPAQVLQLIAPWKTYIVRGNHEDMLASARLDPQVLPEIERRYGSALEVAINSLDSAQLDMLCNLPHPLSVELDSMKILLCHGSPWDNDVYIYPDASEDMMNRCAIEGYDLVVMGHTHYPMLKTIGTTQLLNPGSVGQPRNREPGAQWAMIDTITREISLHNEYYDVEPVLSEARLRHPELPYLADVLVRT